jgi:hypothetical protein
MSTSRETGFSVTSAVYQRVIRELTDNELFRKYTRTMVGPEDLDL